MAEDANPSSLVVVAHPDDVDFGAAGTVALWTASGCAVSYLIVTDGEAGGSDRAMARSEMAAIRRDEQRAAAAEVGVHAVEFLGYPDGRVVADLSLRGAIARAIRRLRPDRLVCPSPERDYARIFASHPDHLAVGEAALCAAYPDARNPFAFPELLDEGLEPYAVGEVWLMASPRSDHHVDITEFIDKKIAALLAHKSQISDPEAIGKRILTMTGEIARNAGFGEAHYAESFAVLTIPR